MANHKLKFFFKVSLGILIFGVLVWKIGPSLILKNLTQFKIAALVLINVTTLSGFLMGGIGVIVLGKTVSPKLEWQGGMEGFLGSISLALFVPGRAGDLSLPFYWKRFLRYGECLAVVLLDKVNTVFWVLSFGACGLYFIFRGYTGFFVAVLGYISIFSLILLVSISKTRNILSRVLPEKVLDFLEGSMTAFRTVAKKGKRNLAAVFVLTGVRVFTYGVGFWVSLWGLDVSSPFFYSVFLMAIAQFVSFIPISVMGLGTVEAVCVYGLAQIGTGPSLVIAALLAGRVITLFWLSLFFLMFTLKKDLTKIASIKNAMKIY